MKVGQRFRELDNETIALWLQGYMISILEDPFRQALIRRHSEWLFNREMDDVDVRHFERLEKQIAIERAAKNESK